MRIPWLVVDGGTRRRSLPLWGALGALRYLLLRLRGSRCHASG